jgi:threonine dehydrogenase-like Zn-dependent dehydrogenase
MVAERPSGLSTADDPARIGNEFIGIVENTGSEVTAVKKATWSSPRSPSSDGTCEFCREDLYMSCVHGTFWALEPDEGGQAKRSGSRSPTAPSSSSPSRRTQRLCRPC